jgi:hypothetical protein
MLGHSVTVNRTDGTKFSGILMRQDENGVIVEDQSGLGYQTRLFIPYAQIRDIQDRGRAP